MLSAFHWPLQPGALDLEKYTHEHLWGGKYIKFTENNCGDALWKRDLVYGLSSTELFYVKRNSKQEWGHTSGASTVLRKKPQDLFHFKRFGLFFLSTGTSRQKLMSLCITFHATIFYRWTTFPLLTYLFPLLQVCFQPSLETARRRKLYVGNPQSGQGESWNFQSTTACK